MNSGGFFTQEWRNDLSNVGLMFYVIYELISCELCSSGFVHEEFTLKYVKVKVVVGFIGNAENKSFTCKITGNKQVKERFVFSRYSFLLSMSKNKSFY
jgi:hypothetical protein